MKVSDVMTRNPTVISPVQSICDAAKMMAECDAGVLPVGENDRLVGMITDRDIAIRAVGQNRGPDTPVRDVMSQEVLYCFEDEDVGEVSDKMSEWQVRRLPVLNRDKRLVGIVSFGDLAQNEDAKTTGKTIAHISEHGGAHSQTSH